MKSEPKKQMFVCQNCEKVVGTVYQVRRFLDLGFVSIAFNKKHLENVCMDCLSTSVLFFVDKRHTVSVSIVRKLK